MEARPGRGFENRFSGTRWVTGWAGVAPSEAGGLGAKPPSRTGLDEGAGAGTFDAEPSAAGWRGESWRRAVDVFIFVFFVGGVGALSFTSTTRGLRV